MLKEKNSNLSYLKVFFVLLAVIVFSAMVFRIYNSYVNRSFTQNIFNILIISDKYVSVVGVDEKNKSLSTALVIGDLGKIKRENIMLQSINFGIPIHAYILYPKSADPMSPTKSFFSPINIQKTNTDINLKSKNLVFFDWLKLYQIGKSIDEDNVNIKTYATIYDLRALLQREKEDFFRDSSLAGRKTSLQIINGTNINGLATEVGEMFSRTGFNVVSILTENKQSSKIVYSSDDVYQDALLIGKSFNFPIEKSFEYQIASVTLIIGEESELELENLVR